MERIVNSSAYLMNKTVYQGFNTNLSLERLGNYSSQLTQNRNISCLCWSEHNHVRLNL